MPSPMPMRRSMMPLDWGRYGVELRCTICVVAAAAFSSLALSEPKNCHAVAPPNSLMAASVHGALLDLAARMSQTSVPTSSITRPYRSSSTDKPMSPADTRSASRV